MSYIRVHFRVYCSTSLGQAVGLGGSSHALGSYEKDKVIKLVTTPESYPVWYTESPILLLKEDVDISYKYCLIEGGKAQSFESSQRMLSLKVSDDIILEDKLDIHSISEAENDSEAELLMKIQEYKNIGNSVNFASTSSRLIIACYHLPVKIIRSDNKDVPFVVTWSESLISKSRSITAESRETVWFGTVDVPGEPLSIEEKTSLTTVLKQMNCYPIFIAHDVTEAAYRGFCKKILWPIFHNVDQLDQIHAAWNLSNNVNSESAKDKVSLDWNETSTKYLTAFKSVTQSFLEALVEVTKDNDTIWVHDYHLILLPKLLRETLKNKYSIVFFMHIPFPTSQIFRTLPIATELLYSMTCADVVGFHSFDHARHFLNATKRTLGIRSSIRQGGMLSLKLNDREVIVTMSHVSIEPDLIDECIANPEVQKKAAEIRKKYEDKKIIVGVDVCQRLSGGSLKLAAYEKLLNDYSSVVGKVVLVQKSVRPNNRELDEKTTSSDLTKMVTLLNSKFSRSNNDQNVIEYDEVSSLSLKDRVALWLAADVFLLTSIREGLNLLPLEYLYARKDLECTGVVVASEYTACSSLLSGSLKVNPFYTLGVADTLHRALEMSASECKQRLQRDLPFVANHPSSKWTNEILYDLESMHHSNEKNKLHNTISTALSGRDAFGTILKTYESASDQGIASAGRRLFVFDYGGTLIDKEKSDVYIKHSLSAISGRLPTANMMNAIHRLSQDPQNIVMVVTGLTKVKLGDVFQNMKNVTIATSSGLIYSWGDNFLSKNDETEYIQEGTTPSSGDSQRRWGCLDFNIDWEAVRDIALPIMTRFTFRTNGTCLSPRFPGIGWSYFGADPEWGESQAVQLKVLHYYNFIISYMYF